MRLFFVLIAVAGLLQAQYGPPRVLATVSIPKLRESSGLAASRAHPGVIWSHNDSGGGPYLYAFDRNGRALGRWSVTGARNEDWEDIAIGPGPRKGQWYLYIGDIGDNDRDRESVTVYRVPEPDPKSKGRATAVAERIRVRYPDRPHDAECLMVHPVTGDVYIVTKARGADTQTIVYRVSPAGAGRGFAKVRKVADVDLPDSAFTLIVGRVTGGDISPSGDRVILCDYFRGWEAVLPSGARSFDDIWRARWREVDLGSRGQGEGICYRADGEAVLASSEGASFPLIEAVRRR